MRKVYEIPTLRLLMMQEDVITSSGDTVHFDDEEALGKNDRNWPGF